MAGAVDGLISGMSTSQVISQLLQIEAAPQTALKKKVSTEENRKAAMQSINAKLAALKTAAETVNKAETWKVVKGTSSDMTAATVSSTTGATTGSLAFQVKELAAAHVVTVKTNDPAAALATGAEVTIRYNDGRTKAVTVGADKTMAGVAKAINDANTDVKATVITAGGETVLQLTATKTGYNAGFTIDDADADAVGDAAQLSKVSQVATAGKDAEIVVGSGAGAFTVKSATNTFTDVLPGTSITVLKDEANVTVTVAAHADYVADKVQAMVEAANALRSEIANLTKYDASKKQAGLLLGNSMIESFRSNVITAVNTPATGMPAGYESYKKLGIELEKNTGAKITFDRNAFLAAYNADPVATQTAVTTGIGKAMFDRSKVDGEILTGTITQRENVIKELNTQVSNWDTRLEQRRRTLQRQFTNMETTLGKLKDQSGWLAGQIASLPTGSN